MVAGILLGLPMITVIIFGTRFTVRRLPNTGISYILSRALSFFR